MSEFWKKIARQVDATPTPASQPSPAQDFESIAYRFFKDMSSEQRIKMLTVLLGWDATTMMEVTTHGDERRCLKHALKATEQPSPARSDKDAERPKPWEDRRRWQLVQLRDAGYDKKLPAESYMAAEIADWRALFASKSLAAKAQESAPSSAPKAFAYVTEQVRSELAEARAESAPSSERSDAEISWAWAEYRVGKPYTVGDSVLFTAGYRAALARRATAGTTTHDFDSDGVCRRCCAYSSKAHLPCVAGTTAAPVEECGNCFEGKSDGDHVCRVCNGSGRATAGNAAPTEAYRQGWFAGAADAAELLACDSALRAEPAGQHDARDAARYRLLRDAEKVPGQVWAALESGEGVDEAMDLFAAIVKPIAVCDPCKAGRYAECEYVLPCTLPADSATQSGGEQGTRDWHACNVTGVADNVEANESAHAGCAIDGNGTTYHNVSEIYHQAEECEALHLWLDDQGMPRADAEGRVFSPVGRLAGMAHDAARFQWLIEDHDDAEVREQARALAKRLGTSSYFAITRDIDAAMAPGSARGRKTCNNSSSELASNTATAAPGDLPRYYMDHGVLHDRETGGHLWTQDEYDAHGRANYADGVQDQMGGTAMSWAVKRATDTIGHLLAATDVPGDLPPLPLPTFKDIPTGGFLSQNAWTAEQMCEYGRACIASNAGAAIPEGFKLLSREPVEAMIHAAEDLPAPRMFGTVWRAMWDAAPSNSPAGAKEKK